MMLHSVDMTTVADAGRQPDTYHAGRPMVEPGQTDVTTYTGRDPDLFAFPRQPFAGLRLVLDRLVHHTMPPGRLNNGGPGQAIVTNGEGYFTGATHLRDVNAQNRAVRTWQAVAQPEPYYEYTAELR